MNKNAIYTTKLPRVATLGGDYEGGETSSLSQQDHVIVPVDGRLSAAAREQHNVPN